MIVACVWTGTKYPVDYVHRLKAGVARHLPQPHAFVCLTDRPDDLGPVTAINVKDTGLRGWWAKMALFDFAAQRRERVIYLDLDTVVTGSLTPLALLGCEFGICGSFTRAAGNLTWPCRYGSCVMTIAPGFGAEVWRGFESNRTALMAAAGHYGDQHVIEQLIPAATILQDVMPPGFFLGYRDFEAEKPEGCALAIFAGKAKPHTCEQDWIRREWTV